MTEDQRFPRVPNASQPSSTDGDEPVEEHEGATEDEVGDSAGPGAGYDNEPEQEKDTGGVS